MYTLSYQVMLPPEVLGRRIRFFRNRAGISQFDLEIALDASAGMISRIESGKVNPTKETITKIAGELSINSRELDYLIGAIATPATKKQVDQVIAIVKGKMDSPSVFSYLIDDRFRLLYLSKGFERLFSNLIPNYFEVKDKVLGHTMAQILVDKSIGVVNTLDKEQYENMLLMQLGRLKKHMDFMFDDIYYKEVLDIIQSDPKVIKIWESIDEANINFNSIDAKTVVFHFKGFKFKMNFARECVWNYPRFETVEYIPTNKLVQFMLSL